MSGKFVVLQAVLVFLLTFGVVAVPDLYVHHFLPAPKIEKSGKPRITTTPVWIPHNVEPNLKVTKIH